MLTKEPFKGNQTLATELYFLINEHYRETEPQNLADKVKYEIIPMIVQIFFEANKCSIPNDLQGQLDKDVKGSSNFSPVSPDLSCINRNRKKQKENVQPNTKSLKIETQLGKKIQCLKEKPQKILSICFLFVFFLQKEKKNQRQCFLSLQKYTRQVKEKIVWFDKWLNANRIRKALLKFYLNYQACVGSEKAIYCFQKLYLRKISAYFEQICKKSHPDQKLKKATLRLKEVGAQKIIKLLRINLQKGFQQIRDAKKSNNPWQCRWIRNIALKTKLNTQTSFWRIVNYSEGNSSTGKDSILIPRLIFGQAFSDKLMGSQKILHRN